MKVVTISKILDRIYFNNLTEDEKNNIRLYAPYVLHKDPIGSNYVSKCINANRFDNFIKLLRVLFIIWYAFFLIIYPLFYSSLSEIPLFTSIKSISLGLTDFFYNLRWYWGVLIHIGAIIILLFIFTIFEDMFDSRLSSYYKHKNKLEEYVVILLNKGLMTAENIDKSKLSEKNDNHPMVQTNKIYNNMSNQVFIVHGHDNSTKFEVARFVEKIGLKAIILHEQVSAGKTIIEKIEKYSNVIFGIVLLTPDDKMSNDTYRARQNVVFELGYLMSKLGRHRICALIKDNVEIPSDISGVIYIPYDKDGAWKIKVANEMKSVGIKIDLNALY